ncbi:MAG TPA: serine hydrolase domain-containing protein [Candidatus Nitrosotenuis sp.]|nr:serine hydrolase domain-containing protein [Candidatus Nitrosotenuis sp.]
MKGYRYICRKTIFLGLLFGLLSMDEAFSKHLNLSSHEAHFKEHRFNKTINNLTKKLRNLSKNPNIRPFNGEVVFAIGGKIIAQQSICQVNHIQSVVRVGYMKYGIASLTKQITAALILKAVEGGKLRLDDPVAHYLTPDDVDDLTLPKFKATIHQILSHTSGFIDGQNEPICAPGSDFHYASWGYAVLGQVLANVYHAPFSTLANRFFQKIGMNHAIAPERLKISELRQHYQDLMKGYHCDRHDSFEEANPEIGGNRGAAGGIIATARDLILWNQALHHGKVLNLASYKLMIKPYAKSNHSLFGTFGYGYGLQISKTRAGLEYSHLGHIPGYQSMLLYYPKADLTVVVLINSDRLGEDSSLKANKHLRLVREIALDVAVSLQNNRSYFIHNKNQPKNSSIDE